MKRTKGTDHLFQGNKLSGKDLTEIREYIVELEKRLVAAHLVGSIK